MTRMIKNQQIIEDNWVLLKGAESDKLQELSTSDLIIPLHSWLQWQKEGPQGGQQLNRPGRIAVWLDSHELPAQLGNSLHKLEMIALNFPVFRDGRPYSSARELRQNFAFKGDIRAVGDVLRDQLFYMQRCGFTEFAMREDQNLQQALTAFEDFHEGYQSSIDRPLPLFRRRA